MLVVAPVACAVDAPPVDAGGYPCSDDSDCATEYLCIEGMCQLDGCASDGDCEAGLLCVDGICESCYKVFCPLDEICVMPEGASSYVCRDDCSSDPACEPEFECREVASGSTVTGMPEEVCLRRRDN